MAFFSQYPAITLMREGLPEGDETRLSRVGIEHLAKNALFLHRRSQAIPRPDHLHKLLSYRECGCKISWAEALPPVDLIVHSGLTLPKLSASVLREEFRALGNVKMKEDESRAWLYGQQKDIDRGTHRLLDQAETQSAKHLLLIVHEGTINLVAKNLVGDLLQYFYPKNEIDSSYGMALTLQAENWTVFRNGTARPVDGPYYPAQLYQIQSNATNVVKELVAGAPLYINSLSAWLAEPAGGGGARGRVDEALSIHAEPHLRSGDIDSPVLRAGRRR